MLPIYIVLWVLAYAVAVTASIVVAVFLFFLFYLVFVILVFRIFFMFLCKSRRVNKKNELLANNRRYTNP